MPARSRHRARQNSSKRVFRVFCPRPVSVRSGHWRYGEPGESLPDAAFLNVLSHFGVHRGVHGAMHVAVLILLVYRTVQNSHREIERTKNKIFEHLRQIQVGRGPSDLAIYVLSPAGLWRVYHVALLTFCRLYCTRQFAGRAVGSNEADAPGCIHVRPGGWRAEGGRY